jgi:ABC-type polysaccharide/polyol phosphate export permease
MYLCSGVFFSSAKFPEPMQPFIKALPLTALNDALRAVMIDGASLGSVGIELAICAAWGIGCFGLALRLFKWR